MLKQVRCRGGIDFFFVSAADGLAYPCGYRGRECLGDYADMDKQSAGTVPFLQGMRLGMLQGPVRAFLPFLQDLLKTPPDLQKNPW